MSIVSVDKDYESLSLVVVAEFEASIERVWQLWADPRKLERWWGPPEWPARFNKHDLAVGGEATYFMTGPEGRQSNGWWRVTAVDPPRSLEFTDGFADRDGAPIPDGATIAAQIRLGERDGRTRMELRFTYSSRDHMDRIERMGAFEAIPQCVSQMDPVLEEVP